MPVFLAECKRTQTWKKCCFHVTSWLKFDWNRLFSWVSHSFMHWSENNLFVFRVEPETIAWCECYFQSTSIVKWSSCQMGRFATYRIYQLCTKTPPNSEIRRDVTSGRLYTSVTIKTYILPQFHIHFVLHVRYKFLAWNTHSPGSDVMAYLKVGLNLPDVSIIIMRYLSDSHSLTIIIHTGHFCTCPYQLVQIHDST